MRCACHISDPEKNRGGLVWGYRVVQSREEKKTKERPLRVELPLIAPAVTCFKGRKCY